MKFVYCIQTESDLPSQYAEIKDRAIVLSWKSRGDDTTIYMPNSTWNTGRNALINHLNSGNVDYDYAIFLDDDLEFIKGDFAQFEDLVRKNPDWIVGTVSDDCVRDPNQPYRFMNSDCNHLDWQVVPQFDACFSCFRRDLIESNRILPYDESWDHITWWASQIVLCQKLNALNVPIYYVNKISVKNSKSRPYPRQEEIIRNIAIEINRIVNTQFGTSIPPWFHAASNWRFYGGN